VRLAPKTSSFKSWSEHLQRYAESEALRAEVSYWQSVQRSAGARLPVDHSGAENTIASGRAVRVALSQAQTEALLREIPPVYHTQINDVLLTALAQALQGWSGRERHVIALEGHGREELFDDLDVSRTVGWFTSVFPVVLELGGLSEPGAALKGIKEQLRQIPQRGVGYGILRYLRAGKPGGSEERAPQGEPELAFNYLGQFEQSKEEPGLWQPAAEGVGATRSAEGRRQHLIEVNGSISGGCLQLSWSYSEAVHERATIKTLAEQ
jgi:non-ribosomal peptide synthase protein (TIGR01720 family)